MEGSLESDFAASLLALFQHGALAAADALTIDDAVCDGTVDNLSWRCGWPVGLKRKGEAE